MPHRVPINVYKPTVQDIGTPKHIKNMSAGYSRANVIQTAGSAAVTFTSNNVWCLDLKNEMPQDSLAPNYFNKSLIQGLSASEASEKKLLDARVGCRMSDAATHSTSLTALTRAASVSAITAAR
jgi:hypothetical protein